MLGAIADLTRSARDLGVELGRTTLDAATGRVQKLGRAVAAAENVLRDALGGASDGLIERLTPEGRERLAEIIPDMRSFLGAQAAAVLRDGRISLSEERINAALVHAVKKIKGFKHAYARISYDTARVTACREVDGLDIWFTGSFCIEGWRVAPGEAWIEVVPETTVESAEDVVAAVEAQIGGQPAVLCADVDGLMDRIAGRVRALEWTGDRLRIDLLKVPAVSKFLLSSFAGVPFHQVFRVESFTLADGKLDVGVRLAPRFRESAGAPAAEERATGESVDSPVVAPVETEGGEEPTAAGGADGDGIIEAVVE